jgi:hypothetical protein
MNGSDLDCERNRWVFEHNVLGYGVRCVRRASKMYSRFLLEITRRHRKLNVRLNLSQTSDGGYVDQYNCRDSIVSNAKGRRAEGFASRLLEPFPPGRADTSFLPTVPEADMACAGGPGGEGHEGAQLDKSEQSTRIVRPG